MTTCPKCGNDKIVETGCSRRGFRRYGGLLNPRTEPVACRRNDIHKHFSCTFIRGMLDIGGCGHRWTK